MKVDFVVKDAWVFMTYRQCFEKRDVAVAGEKIYAVSPAICYPDVTMIDGSGMYMIPGLVDIHMHIESSMTYPAEFSRITLHSVVHGAGDKAGYILCHPFQRAGHQ